MIILREGNSFSKVLDFLKNPIEVKREYASFTDFAKKEIGPKVRGRYYYAGETFSNLEMIRQKVKILLKEHNENSKKLAIDRNLKIFNENVKDVKNGKSCFVIVRNSMVEIYTANEVVELSLFDYRKNVFDLEEKYGFIIMLESYYVTISIKGL